ncbi:hypothetical protein B0H19DRAFT_850793, partial [Mycena capillaripes]
KIIWSITRQLWLKKYAQWPTLDWGLILGCNLFKFRTANGALIPEKGRLFAVLTESEIHNRW